MPFGQGVKPIVVYVVNLALSVKVELVHICNANFDFEFLTPKSPLTESPELTSNTFYSDLTSVPIKWQMAV